MARLKRSSRNRSTPSLDLSLSSPGTQRPRADMSIRKPTKEEIEEANEYYYRPGIDGAIKAKHHFENMLGRGGDKKLTKIRRKINERKSEKILTNWAQKHKAKKRMLAGRRKTVTNMVAQINRGRSEEDKIKLKHK